MIQWVTENTRFREDKPSRLDLLFTKGIDLEKDIYYECPFESNDHMILEIKMKGRDIEVKQDESYKKKRRNYGKVKYTEIQIAKRNLLERLKKVQFSPKKYRYLEWTEGSGDNSKECTSTEGKNTQI